MSGEGEVTHSVKSVHMDVYMYSESLGLCKNCPCVLFEKFRPMFHSLKKSFIMLVYSTNIASKLMSRTHNCDVLTENCFHNLFSYQSVCSNC